ncbi:MAG: hypothetical protein L0Y57_05815 [Beijerinckiaceae bacterium]|nr:hypothetical protein [Beijerinckiaceae bacterium]
MGFYCDATACHGFLRAPNGTFTSFDPPGSINTFLGDGSFAGSAINPAGRIIGTFTRTGDVIVHGFERNRSGLFATFDPPGSNYTIPVAISPAGESTGFYQDVTAARHGFVRANKGAITSFDAPGSAFTQPAAINPVGAITGTYCSFPPGSFPVCHGFLRTPGGNVKTFDAPAENNGTFPTGINPAGVITGWYIRADFSGQNGFLRAPDGTFTTFDPPGSQFTNPLAINPAGVITGWYCDASFVCHGFLGKP